MTSEIVPPRPSPPALAQELASFFAGPHFQEEIVGDLCERFHDRDETKTERVIWYWGQVLRSLPSFVMLRLQNTSRRSLYIEAIFGVLAVSMIWAWEIGIAQKAAWPIASRIVGYTPWSGMIMCKAMYICLYGIAVLMAFTAVSAWRHLTHETRHFAQLHCLLFGLIATTPMIFYLINPTPYGDGLGFRLVQISVVWTLLGLCLGIAARQTRKILTSFG